MYYPRFLHSDVKLFQCHVCGKSFKQQDGLRLHLFVHIKELKFECRVCEKKFKTDRMREDHYISCHMKPDEIDTVKRKVIVCSICNKILRDNDRSVTASYILHINHVNISVAYNVYIQCTWHNK